MYVITTRVEELVTSHGLTFHNATDVKIDWCASNANGSALDPKVQYAEFVSSF